MKIPGYKLKAALPSPPRSFLEGQELSTYSALANFCQQGAAAAGDSQGQASTSTSSSTAARSSANNLFARLQSEILFMIEVQTHASPLNEACLQLASYMVSRLRFDDLKVMECVDSWPDFVEGILWRGPSVYVVRVLLKKHGKLIAPEISSLAADPARAVLFLVSRAIKNAVVQQHCM
ncbi:hypothetical protein CAOG_06181 [Capsaspora owczarzaki ATCC 30864]|uniref:Uncharacterized protein n=1 Tax=Capsaspora owczarzaki (strain ATCC 30864) TaxID=595528 RepID=A0A0D2VW68_CAPO3|nr:hypothetical protein CAOG_06181 [Capsaspora owczarzaki ATCC 30864]KJE95767.1 hypothetical protein CAOG_006181 [Capsaspora owczarzaki ATCC 30864]|eukprot:XP_004345771.1 hypothetical protein CAOG_06181 [Capsaspora owczarzaki ATCC 30864]